MTTQLASIQCPYCHDSFEAKSYTMHKCDKAPKMSMPSEKGIHTRCEFCGWFEKQPCASVQCADGCPHGHHRKVFTETPIDVILKERRQQHGDFTDHARITQALKIVMKIESKGSFSALSEIQREALEMIQHKIGRILAGNPNLKDHWHDIAGYAKLVADRIEE